MQKKPKLGYALTWSNRLIYVMMRVAADSVCGSLDNVWIRSSARGTKYLLCRCHCIVTVFAISQYLLRVKVIMPKRTSNRSFLFTKVWEIQRRNWMGNFVQVF